MALNPVNREVGEVGCSILRAMSAQESMCGREHWRDAVATLLIVWRSVS